MTEPGESARPDPVDGPDVLEVRRDGETAARLRLNVASDSPWLDGHFPDRPVLPGVVQLRWAIGAAARLWPDLETVTEVTQLKFSHPVLPPTELTLRLELDAQRRRLSFGYALGERTCASGRVRFA